MELLIAQAEAGDKRKNAATLKELNASEKCIAELSVIFKRLDEDKVPVRVNFSDWNEKNFYANRASLSYMSIYRSVMGSVAPF